MTTDTDTAAALEAAIDAIACRRCDHDDPIGSADRTALHRAITAHVEAEVARRLAAAPDVEAAIGDLRANAHTHAVGALAMADVEECHAALLAAIAADKARAVEAARPTPDEAHRMINELIGATAIIGNGLDDDPGTVVAKRIAKDARTALLRALGVEA